MCPEYAHIQKIKQIAHHDVYGRFCEQNAGTFRHQTFGPCVSPTALFDRLRKWSVSRARAANLRIVPWPLWMPDDYLRSIEPLIAIVLGCMRWKSGDGERRINWLGWLQIAFDQPLENRARAL
jgi:hypothetical protein